MHDIVIMLYLDCNLHLIYTLCYRFNNVNIITLKLFQRIPYMKCTQKYTLNHMYTSTAFDVTQVKIA